MNKNILQLLTIAALCATPSLAGTLLVPVPEPTLPDQSTRTVRLTFSNLGGVARRATPDFIPAGADGTGPARVEGSSISINPNATVEVEGLAPDGGLLEVTTAPQLIMRAQLVLRNPNGAVVAISELPITDAEAVREPDTEMAILDLARGNGRLSDLMLVAVDTEVDETTCSVQSFNAQGGVAATQTVTLAKYSSTTVVDFLAGVAASQVKTIVSCDSAWDAWAVVTDLANHDQRVIGEAAFGSSTLTAPGACPGICFSQSGTVHTATNSVPNWTRNIPTATNRVYSSMRLEFDLTAGPWYPGDTGGNHSVFWLHRGRSTAPGVYTPYDSNVFGASNIKGTRNRLLLVTNIDEPPGAHSFDPVTAQLIPGETYHVAYQLTGATRTATLTITRNGVIVGSTGASLGGVLGSRSADAFMLYFGHPLIQGGVEVPWAGTTWSNVVFEALP